MADYEAFPGIHVEGWPHAWVALVAKLCTPGKPIETAERLKEIVPILLKRYPPECFNQSSALDLAERVSGVPSLKSMSMVLAKWKDALAPPSTVPALQSPEDWKERNRPPAPTHFDRAREWDKPGAIRQHVYEIQDRMEWAMTGKRPPDGGPVPSLDVEARLAALLTACVARYASQHMGHLPPEWIERHEKSVANQAR